MFDRISRRYDLLNRVLSLGLDGYWRRKTIGELSSDKHLRILDLACGTGDVPIAAALACPNRQVVGVDKAAQMLALAQRKIEDSALGHRVLLIRGDGMNIPAGNGSFDAVTIAFGIRNMPDTLTCLSELHRLLRIGGKAVILEFSLPRNRLLKALHIFYLRRIVPRVGKFLSGDGYAYSYLNKTIETYPYGAEFCSIMSKAGFADVSSRPLTMGIVSIYTGIKN
jgi:demethylmenaquinone methyltransferase/2-methoxy-6-polyprenyl-1,4-benzoquinol methylase